MDNTTGELILAELERQSILLARLVENAGMSSVTQADMPSVRLELVQSGRILSEEEDRQRGEKAAKERAAAKAANG